MSHHMPFPQVITGPNGVHYKINVSQLLVLLDGLYVMLLNIFSLNVECFPIPGETVRATMIPAPIKFIGMSMTAGINKVTIQVVMVTSTLFVHIWYLLLPIVTLSMLNSQSLISTFSCNSFSSNSIHSMAYML